MQVANSYKGYTFDETKAYEKGGKLYVHATCKCDRCVKGVFVSRIENGHIVPHPAYNGVCLRCGGSGYLTKEIRLYTDEEFAKMEKANEKARAKREAEREAKIKAEYAGNKLKWLSENGYDENGDTYIVTGDSYSIKDELKAAGFRWCAPLKVWMRASANGYEDRTIKVNVENLAEFSAWGKGTYFKDAVTYIKSLMPAAEDEIEYAKEFVGSEGDKLEFDATLVRKSGFDGAYGHQFIYTFVDELNHLYTWFTKKELDYEIGDTMVVSGTVKTHKEYKDQFQTVLTRCKIA